MIEIFNSDGSYKSNTIGKWRLTSTTSNGALGDTIDTFTDGCGGFETMRRREAKNWLKDEIDIVTKSLHKTK